MERFPWHPRLRPERQPSVPRDQKRDDHEPDHEARGVGEKDGDHPRHDGTDRKLQLVPPRPGHPDAECHPGEGE